MSGAGSSGSAPPSISAHRLARQEAATAVKRNQQYSLIVDDDDDGAQPGTKERSSDDKERSRKDKKRSARKVIEFIFKYGCGWPSFGFWLWIMWD